jgi:hypothetical protein
MRMRATIAWVPTGRFQDPQVCIKGIFHLKNRIRGLPTSPVPPLS